MNKILMNISISLWTIISIINAFDTTLISNIDLTGDKIEEKIVFKGNIDNKSFQGKVSISIYSKSEKIYSFVADSINWPDDDLKNFYRKYLDEVVWDLDRVRDGSKIRESLPIWINMWTKMYLTEEKKISSDSANLIINELHDRIKKDNAKLLWVCRHPEYCNFPLMYSNVINKFVVVLMW